MRDVTELKLTKVKTLFWQTEVNDKFKLSYTYLSESKMISATNHSAVSIPEQDHELGFKIKPAGERNKTVLETTILFCGKISLIFE